MNLTKLQKGFLALVICDLDDIIYDLEEKVIPNFSVIVDEESNEVHKRKLNNLMDAIKTRKNELSHTLSHLEELKNE